jgi:hypothetical protein
MRLVIYNLETNLDSSVLAAAHDWIEAFATQVDQVVVYSTHVGRYALAANVEVYEIGGGSVLKRITAVTRLLKSFKREVSFRRDLVVFHHMSTRTLLILGPLYRIFRVKQALWYSHSKKSLTLRVSHSLADVIFSSNRSSIPLNGDKLRFVGHGLKSSRFISAFSNSKGTRSGIVILGRLAPIKRIELLLGAIVEAKIGKVALTCIGSSQGNDKYQRDLSLNAGSKGVDLQILHPIPYGTVAEKLVEFDSIYTGTPKSVDKAVIEGAMCGCFVLTTECQTLKQTGMDLVLDHMGFRGIPSLPDQLKAILDLREDQKLELRRVISKRAAELNDVGQATSRILAELERI